MCVCRSAGMMGSGSSCRKRRSRLTAEARSASFSKFTSSPLSYRCRSHSTRSAFPFTKNRPSRPSPPLNTHTDTFCHFTSPRTVTHFSAMMQCLEFIKVQLKAGITTIYMAGHIKLLAEIQVPALADNQNIAFFFSYKPDWAKKIPLTENYCN